MTVTIKTVSVALDDGTSVIVGRVGEQSLGASPVDEFATYISGRVAATVNDAAERALASQYLAADYATAAVEAASTVVAVKDQALSAAAAIEGSATIIAAAEADFTAKTAAAVAAADTATAAATSTTNNATTVAALLNAFRRVLLGAFGSDQDAETFAAANSIPIADGLMYENTYIDKFRVYTGTAWADYDASAQAQQQAATLSATNAAASAASAQASASTATTSATQAATNATATAADRVQTGSDRTASASSASTALTQAGIATTKAAEAAASAASNVAVTWSNLSGKPATFPPDAHGHADLQPRSANLDGWAGIAPASKQAALGFTPVNKAGDTMTGALYVPGVVSSEQGHFRGSQDGTIATATPSTGGVHIQSPFGQIAAYMTFHRSGQFAANFGLDADNYWKVGGWSYGQVAYKLYHEGNPPSVGVQDVRLGAAQSIYAWPLPPGHVVAGHTDTWNSKPIQKLVAGVWGTISQL